MAQATGTKVTFRVTTYWKRPRGQTGITQLASRRLQPLEALQWVLDYLPDGAVTIAAGNGEALTLVIDRGKLDA